MIQQFLMFSGLRSHYPDDVLLGFGDQLALQLLGHLGVQELGEGPLDGQRPLPVPLLHLVAELVPVVELLDLLKVGLVPRKPGEKGTKRRTGQGSEIIASMIKTKMRSPTSINRPSFWPTGTLRSAGRSSRGRTP